MIGWTATAMVDIWPTAICDLKGHGLSRKRGYFRT
jgi:hypothetical protein